MASNKIVQAVDKPIMVKNLVTGRIREHKSLSNFTELYGLNTLVTLRQLRSDIKVTVGHYEIKFKEE